LAISILPLPITGTRMIKNQSIDLTSFINAVRKQTKEEFKGAVLMWGFEKAVEMFVGRRILEIERGQISYKNFMDKWGE